ncbi:hypothetical protein HY416_02545 [Candidatus Kaiserbacteria bacterium]|nr:hypothetical protein [Candidatus Kaiserbacteria bacterium]
MSTYRSYTLGRLLKWLAGAAATAALGWYIVFQAWPLITGPALTLDPMPVAQSGRVTTVSGTARNVTTITLNDRPIFTDDEGHFQEALVLENGYTILTLRAKDRYGRKKTLEQALVYAPAYSSADER